MPGSSLLHYALEVPDQRSGDLLPAFAVVAAGGGRCCASPPRRLGARAPCSTAGQEASPSPVVRRAGRRDRGGPASMRRADVREVDPPRGARRRILAPRPRRPPREVRPEGREEPLPDPPLAVQQPGHIQREGPAREPRAKRPGHAPEARPRPPLHARRRSPDRLSTPGSSAQAVRPREEPHRLHALHADHHNVAFLTSKGPGSTTRRSRSARSTRSRSALRGCATPAGRWAGARPPVIGSNYFYYTRDPWGSFAEYYHDLDFIPRSAPGSPDFPEETRLCLGPPLPPSSSRTPSSAEGRRGARWLAVLLFSCRPPPCPASRYGRLRDRSARAPLEPSLS